MRKLSTQIGFLINTSVLAFVIALLHYVAIEFSLYWSIPPLDILMHFLGGLFIGMLAAYVFFISNCIKITAGIRNRAASFLIIIFSVLVVGLAWELWELFVGLSDRLNDRADTIMDLVMDTLGGTVAFLYSKNKINE